MGVAVNVTGVPEHTGLAPATDTLTGSLPEIVIVTVLEVAGEPVAHGASDVNTQLTAFPLVGVKV